MKPYRAQPEPPERETGFHVSEPLAKYEAGGPREKR